MDVPPVPDPIGSMRVRQLSMGERWGAIIAGALLGGGGGAAVFLTSNQAGSTALVLMGALFVLLGIQGTPVTRASKDSVELASRPEVIAAKAKEIAEERDPGDGRVFLEGAVSADPKLKSSQVIRDLTGDLYEMQVRHALELIAWDRRLVVERSPSFYDGLIDLSLRGGPDPQSSIAIDVIVKFSKRELPILSGNLKNLRIKGRFVPLLLVSNSGFSEALIRNFELIRESGTQLQWVQWNGAEDSDVLAASVDQLVKAVNGDVD